jgi:spore maturation protein CgeB
VEDTEEHRQLFGRDGEAVIYFQTLDQMVQRLRWLLDSPDERERLAAAVRRRIVSSRHTYDDRLREMLNNVASTERAERRALTEEVAF